MTSLPAVPVSVLLRPEPMIASPELVPTTWPVVSTCSAVKAWDLPDRSEVWKLHLPSAPAVTEPAEVVPSDSLIWLLGSAMPLIVAV